MVDVTGKEVTVRSATAEGLVTCPPAVVALLRSGDVPKGDVLAVAGKGHEQGQTVGRDVLPFDDVSVVRGIAGLA